MKIMIIGPMNSGKGTYASRMSKSMGIPHISTGQIFRDNIAAKTELGEKVEKFLVAGALVPDELVMQVVKERIGKQDCKGGFIFDGFPRSLEQAVQFDKMSKFDVVVYLDVPKEVIIQRALSRRTCKKCSEIFNVVTFPPKKEGVCDKCGGELVQRADETPDGIKKRLDEYEMITKPLIDYYGKQGILKRINFKNHNASPEENVKIILQALGVKK
ncbi:MAG: nucleoside monophosphate kinase [Candidatus Aenigmatarchaeota archaeon]